MVFAAALLCGHSAQAVTDTWKAATSGSWSVTGNWVNGVVPDAVGDVAISTTSGTTTSTLDENVTLGMLTTPNSTNNGVWIINPSGGNFLTMQNTAGSQALIASEDRGAITVNANIVIGSSDGLRIAAGGNTAGSVVTVTGNITGTGPLTLDTTFVGSGQAASSVVISGTINNTGTLTIAGPSTLPFSSTAEMNNPGSLSFVTVGSIANTVTSITANGNNYLKLTGTTGGFGGLITVNNGIVQLTSTNAVNLGATTYSVASGAVLAVNAGGTNEFTSSNINSLMAATTFSAGSFLGIDTTDALSGFTYATSITGSLGLVKPGATTLTLGGSNSFTGRVSIQSGTLSVSTINSVSGGSGTSSLGAPTTIANGTIDLGSLNTYGASNNNVGSTGSLLYTGVGETTDRVINLVGNGVIDASGSGLLKFTSNLTSLAMGTAPKTLTLQGTGTGEFAGSIVDSGSGNATKVAKSGSGTWTLSGSSSFSGGTTLNSGVLIISNSNALGTGALQLSAASTSGTLESTFSGYNFANATTLGGVATIGGTEDITFSGSFINGGNETLIVNNNAGTTLSGNVFLGNNASPRTLTISGSANTLISGSIANSTSTATTSILAKTGSGMLTISGNNNTYSGTTSVSQGNLRVTNTAGSATGSSIVTLTGSNASGITNPVLSGNGIISGAVTTTGTSALIGASHLAPGIGSTPGTLTLGNGLTIGNGTDLDFDLGSISSLIAVTGNLSLGGNVVLNPTSITGFGLNTVYDLINFSGTLLNSGSLSSWTASSLPGGATGYSFAVVSGTEITVTFTGSGSAAPTVAYWQGALSGTWATVTSGSTNFTSDAAGATNTGAIPGAVTNVKFTANSASNLTTVLGQDFTINSLEFTGTGSTAATTSVTIGGTNTLTIMAGGTNGNTAGNGITVDAGSAAHTISSNVALGSSQTWTVSGSALTVSGNVSSGGNAYGLTKSGTGTLILSGSDSYTGATAVNAGALEVDGSLSGSSAVTVGVATLSGTGNIGGSVALTGTSNMSSAGTLTVASLGVSGGGNTISGGTVNATGGTTINSGGNLAVNGSLGGAVGVSGVLSGTGTLTGAVTVSAGGVTSPGVGSAPGVLTSDLAYSASSTANFNVSSGSGSAPQGHLSNLYYSQMMVTGGSGAVSLAIGNNVTLGANSALSVAQTGSQIVSGTSNSGVTLQLSLSSADYAALVSKASTNYDAKSANTGLDNYFVFNLGTTLSTGRFTTLDLDVNGVNTSGTIYYSGSNDRFAADGVGNTIGDVIVGTQEYALSYTGSFGTNSTTGGNDVVLTAIPEPGTWGMILGGFGMLVGFQRFRKRRGS